MKKITILTFAMLLTLSNILSINTFASVSVDVENAVSCTTGVDADEDTLIGLADPDCSVFMVTPLSETLTSCTTGVDADEDTLIGLADPDCSVFMVTPLSETLTSCTTGVDADEDTLIGLADPDCSVFMVTATTTATTTESVATTTNTGGNGGWVGSSSSGGSQSGGSSFSGGSVSTGTPISTTGLTSGTPISTLATSTCDDMFKTYMKKGNKGGEVKKLQSFLNSNLGLKIKLTGYFGDMTFNAVKKFQEKYKDNVLSPWGSSKSTGYFYKTTQRQANMLLCSGTEIPMPELK